MPTSIILSSQLFPRQRMALALVPAAIQAKMGSVTSGGYAETPGWESVMPWPPMCKVNGVVEENIVKFNVFFNYQ